MMARWTQATAVLVLAAALAAAPHAAAGTAPARARKPAAKDSSVALPKGHPAIGGGMGALPPGHAAVTMPPGHGAGGMPPGHGVAGMPSGHPQMGRPKEARRIRPVLPSKDLAGNLRVRAVTLHIFHRVFANFHDRVDAHMHREFRIGDTDYTATVVRFVPDFAMELKTGKVTSRSSEPKNPAFQIIVKKNGVPQDTTWAFLDMPPHFARQSLVAFLATQVSFDNHAAVASRDSLALRLMGKAGR